MKVSDVRGYALSSPIEPVQDRPFHGGVRRLHKRDVVLVVVETESGLEGYATAGASSSAMKEYFDGESQGTFADVVDGEVADAVVGERIEEPGDVKGLLADSDLPGHLRTEAVSALDVACWDLKGKAEGKPVYELLAETYDSEPTTEMPLYASAGMYMEPEGYVEQAEALEELGFFGYKYRPGIGVEGDRRTVDLLAEATEEMEVMLDVHTWWKLGEAYGRETVKELVAHAGEQGAYWVEEPVEPDDYDGYRELAETGTPLAGGESEESPEGLVALGETGAVSFLQGDVRHHEGFTGCRPAVEFCEGRDVEFVPHNFGTWFGLMANAHLVAAAPEVSLLEYPVFEEDPALGEADRGEASDGERGGTTRETETDPGMYPFELAFDILEGEPDVEDGVLTLGDEPGLGVDVNLDVIEEYPFQEGPWTEFHYDEE